MKPIRPGSELPEDLQKLYSTRFTGHEDYRNRIWRLLTSEFFSKWVKPTHTVLDVGCGYGEFINNIACKEKIAIAEQAWPLLEAEALRLRSLPTDSGTALDVAGNGRYARKVVIACNRERARRLHVMAPAELAELANTEPSVLVVNSDDLARALASALASEEPGRTAEIVQGTSTKLVHCRPRHESTSIPRHSSSLGWRGRAVVSPIAHGDASALPGRASELRTLCAVGAVARNRIGGAAGGTSSTSLRPSRRRGAVSSTEFGVAETVAA